MTLFFKIYDAAGGHPTVEQLDRDYLAPGSKGLHEFAVARRVSGATIADAIAKHPETYENARRCLVVLPAVKQRLVAAFDSLARMYPEAKFPPVTLLVGRGRPIGITNASGVSIGLEALCAATFVNPNLEDRFVHVITHEYGHIQQAGAMEGLDIGQPDATVLRMSILEGAAEFMAELLTGDDGNYQYRVSTKGHEAAIEAAFVQDEDKIDLSKWMYNGPGDADHPPDLGYWVGHRIVNSYYQHAADKHQALHDIFEMRDPKAFLAASGWSPAGSLQTRPVFLTEDVTRFFKIYDAAGGHPTADQLDRDYLAPGSNGLHEFAALRRVTGARIADAIAKQPEMYAEARSCLAVLPAVKQRLVAVFDTLATLYPEAKFPPVTIVVGRGRPVGLTSPSGVAIGLEAMCTAAKFTNPNLEERFVHTIAHEYGHIQQSSALQTLDAGQPGATVLRMSLIEGGGEFIAELISGDVANHQHKAWTKGHEAAIEAAFVQDEDKTDISKWMYNGPGDADHPSDMGYWVGYRIVKSYYEHATDKHQALVDIFEIRDPKAFLAASGWHPAA